MYCAQNNPSCTSKSLKSEQVRKLTKFSAIKKFCLHFCCCRLIANGSEFIIARSKMEKSIASGGKMHDTIHTRKHHINQYLEDRDWKCNICYKEFNSEMSLRDHEDIHITPFCEMCNKMFKTAKLLHLHQLENHPNMAHQSKDFNSSDDELNICEDLSLSKVKEEPIELVSEPEIENLLNHDPNPNLHLNISPRHSFHSSDYYPETSKSNLGIWRNFTDTPSSSFLNIEHSSVPMNIKLEPVDVPVESDQFDLIINEILQKPEHQGSDDSKLSLVAEEIPMQQNFWTQSDQQAQQEQEIWNCDICNRSFSTKQILQRHRIALHDHNKDFKCDQCDQWFSSSNNHELIKHVNEVHNGFKKFICDFNGCNKEFSRRDALKRHRQTHEAQKAKNVMKQMSGGKKSDAQPTSYSCYDCGLNFRYQTSLLLHLKNHK